MNTPTIQDVNSIGCCCPWPLCPQNRWKHWDRAASPDINTCIPYKEPEFESDEPLTPEQIALQDVPKLFKVSAAVPKLGQEGSWTRYFGWDNNFYHNWLEHGTKFEVSTDKATPAFGFGGEYRNGWTVSVHFTDFYNEGTGADPGSLTLYNEFSHDVLTTSATENYLWGVHQSYGNGTDIGDWFLRPAADGYLEETIADADEEVEENYIHAKAETIRYFTDAPQLPEQYNTGTVEDLQDAGGNNGGFAWDITVEAEVSLDLSVEATKESVHAELLDVLDLTADMAMETDVPQAEMEHFHVFYQNTGNRYTGFFDGNFHTLSPVRDRWPIMADVGAWAAPTDFYSVGRVEESGNPGEWTYGLMELFEPRRIQLRPDALRSRYHVGIPEDWEAKNAAWKWWHDMKEAHDADPTGNPDPGEEPKGKRSVYECQWQEVFFPKAWNEWKAAHDVWLSADPGTRGPEPEKPTEEEDRPSLVEEREWSYGGPGADAFSPPFVMEPPVRPGVIRPVNMLVTCYHCRTGEKPALVGEYINLAAP